MTLIKNADHSRDKSKSVDEIQTAVGEMLDGNANEYLALIRADKQRYARDQFKLLEKMINTYSVSATLKAIEFCENRKLISAVYVKDYLEHNQLPQTPMPMATIPVIPIDDPKYHVTTQKRSLDIYKEVGAAHE